MDKFRPITSEEVVQVGKAVDKICKMVSKEKELDEEDEEIDTSLETHLRHKAERKERREYLKERYLVPRYSSRGYDFSSVCDNWVIVASCIEESLQEAGAKKGDYTLLDLYKLAQPFVLHGFEKGDLEITWTTGVE
jgi:hypothetical protein